jgi:hypothetical protein
MLCRSPANEKAFPGEENTPMIKGSSCRVKLSEHESGLEVTLVPFFFLHLGGVCEIQTTLLSLEGTVEIAP